MFFDLIRRNSKRNRKENGIFFASLIVSVVAFYIILSLRNQDVIIFLQTMESDAVNRLLGLIPALYGFSLFILFFLIYFSSRYQFERRSHELGLYLMMGMRRSRLFWLLLAEDSLSSLISLLAGIPAAVFLSEIISLVTAKLVGLGIIGHRFTFSLSAVLITAAGFFLIKLLAFGILTIQFAGKEISLLLAGAREKEQQVPRPLAALLKLAAGILMIGAAYSLAIMGLSWSSLLYMGMTALLGICGTFLVLYGFSALIEIILRRKKNSRGLKVFTFRQLQENVICRTNSLAVSSLLALLALCCFGFGFSSAWSAYSKSGHVIDYTFEGSREEVLSQTDKPTLSDYIEDVFEVRTGGLRDDIYPIETDQLLDAVSQQEASPEREILLNNLSQYFSPYLISLSGYNHILEISGETPLVLKDGEAAIYNGAEFTNPRLTEVLDKSLSLEPVIKINGKDCRLFCKSRNTNLVVDRLINISMGLIVTDDDFDRLMPEGSYSSYWNASLSKAVTEKSGLMQAITEVNSLLDKTGLNYESYLQNIGRQLFYLTASSYTTIYLALIFLIIANTVLGVQFLMQQKKTGRRYKTLINLGCDYESMRRSARTQIKWYFGIPLILAAVSSIFGIRSLFTGFLSPSMKGDLLELSVIAMAMIILLCVVEYFYIAAVMRLSDKHILELMQSTREE